MKTKIFAAACEEAAEILKRGGLIAVPTETVYGLAGNGLDESAVHSIYEVKGRPAIKPLSLMVSGAAAMDEYCEDVPEAARRLAAAFWPGPLTIVLKAKSFIPSVVLAGGSTVGLRCPDHPLTLELLKLSGLPFAAPSANPSGQASPKNAQTVLDYFDGSIDAVLDGGECGIGTESTIIDMSTLPYKILRQGALPAEEIADELVRGMTVIGITGGSGTGKSTALHTMEDMGAELIDCDKVYHELLKTDKELLEELETGFPGTVKAGTLDRKALAAIVFSDQAALVRLNQITHSHIGAAVREILRAAAMAGVFAAAIDASELFTSGLDKSCSFTVGVTAPVGDRVRRIMLRDGIDEQRARERIQAQRPDTYFAENCTHILVNDEGAEQFINKCRSLFKELL